MSPRRLSRSEASLQGRILRHLLRRPGCWAVKFPGVLQRGVPDILGAYRCRYFALEVKQPGQKPSRLQSAVLEQIRTTGAVAEVVTSVHQVKAILASVEEGTDE